MEKKGNSIIVVVDDEQAISELITAILEEEGYCVAWYTHAAQAWSDLTQRHVVPDLFLLDLLMPDIDGATFRARLHGDAVFSGVPVILMSALSPGAVAPLNQCGDAVLYKPFELETLLETVTRELAQ